MCHCLFLIVNGILQVLLSHIIFHLQIPLHSGKFGGAHLPTCSEHRCPALPSEPNEPMWKATLQWNLKDWHVQLWYFQLKIITVIPFLPGWKFKTGLHTWILQTQEVPPAGGTAPGASSAMSVELPNNLRQKWISGGIPLCCCLRKQSWPPESLDTYLMQCFNGIVRQWLAGFLKGVSGLTSNLLLSQCKQTLGTSLAPWHW